MDLYHNCDTADFKKYKSPSIAADFGIEYANFGKDIRFSRTLWA